MVKHLGSCNLGTNEFLKEASLFLKFEILSQAFKFTSNDLISFQNFLKDEKSSKKIFYESLSFKLINISRNLPKVLFNSSREKFFIEGSSSRLFFFINSNNFATFWFFLFSFFLQLRLIFFLSTMQEILFIPSSSIFFSSQTSSTIFTILQLSYFAKVISFLIFFSTETSSFFFFSHLFPQRLCKLLSIFHHTLPSHLP